jgi:signal transduction histidine kinase
MKDLKELPLDIQKDIEAISNIPAIANILKVVVNATGMGFSAVARVTREKWIACMTNDVIGFGLEAGGELVLESTICHEIRQHHQVVAIDYVAEDQLYKDHHTPKTYGLQSYISVPIILSDGSFFGTLCAIDPNPAKVNNEQTITMFNLFAELIALNLDSHGMMRESERKLTEADENTQLREQFIAILGHDLRNPVNAISNAVQLQLRSEMDERNTKLARIIQDSNTRTKGLIDNILDFASGKLGGGIRLDYELNDSLDQTLSQVVNELHTVWPDRKIQTHFELKHPIRVDQKRMAQLLSNLLGNAIHHGASEKPIEITAVSNPKGMELCITNGGLAIPEEDRNHLFKPFSRGKHKPGKQGLGLGLFIASEIARAHGGEISVESNDTKTCFTVNVPANY